MIMHRFNHVVAKQIKLLFKDGYIEEIGYHEELLENKGTCYELYSIQNEEAESL